MNKKIDLNGLGIIQSVAKELDSKLDELISVNTIISDIGELLDNYGCKEELGYSYSSSKNALDKLDEDIVTYEKAGRGKEYSSVGTSTTMAYVNVDSIEAILDASIDNPFYLSLCKIVENLSNINISEYSVKNPYDNAIKPLKEKYNETGYRSYEKVYIAEEKSKIKITDLLKTRYTRDMMQEGYTSYLKELYPNIEDVSKIEADLFYEEFIRGEIERAEFEYTTGVESFYNGVRVLGGLLAIGAISFTVLPGAATFLGVNVGALSLGAGIVNGSITVVDFLCLISGLDVNGNPLTEKERERLTTSLTIDAAFLSVSIVSKIRYNASRAASSVDDVDDALKIQIEGSGADDSFKNLNSTVDDVEFPKGTWDKGATTRGKDIDGFMNNNTGSNYPVIDNYDVNTETASSVKSRDLNAKSYQNGSTLERTIKKDVDDLANFELVDWGDSTLSGMPINQRELQMVVPNTKLSQVQIDAINNAIEYAKSKGVNIKIIVGH